MGDNRDSKVTQVEKTLPPEQEYERLLREKLNAGSDDLLAQLPGYMERVLRYQDSAEGMYSKLPEYQAQGDELLGRLQEGELPAGYMENLTKGINDNAQNSIGTMLSGLGSKGIVNSSVATTGMRDISRQASKAAADKFLDASQFLAGTAYAPQTAAITAGKAYADLTAPLAQGATGAASLFTPGMNLYKLFSDQRIAQLPDTVVEQGGGK